MLRLLRGLLVAVVVLAVFVGCGGAAEPEAETAVAAEMVDQPVAPTSEDAEFVLRIATNAPERLSTDIVQWEQEVGMSYIFENIVEARSGGRIAVEVFPGGQLGDHLAVCEMVQSGSLEAAIGTGVMANFFPEFEVLYIPYLFKSEEIAWDFLDNSDYWADFSQRFQEETGMVLLAVGQNGTRHFTHTSKTIASPADLEGERVRVMTSPIFVEMMQAFGADPVPIAWSELYTSLQTGVVAGQENPISVIAVNSLYEVQDYITLDGHLWSEDYFILNEAFYDQLPTDLQQIVHAAARQAEVVNRGIETIHSQGPGLQRLREVGMNIYVPTVAQKQEFADIAQPPVIEYLRERIGAETIERLLADVAIAETRMGYR
ncbi:MAG: DctP family TRAP transporter solute-binding subunit [Spirochaetales bacterium]|nr:DctP family TRAP transporter solute-binding subunit [Spirochaetales bacterium]